MADHEKPPPYNYDYGAIPEGKESPPPYPPNAGHQEQPPPQLMPQPNHAQPPPQTNTTIIYNPTMIPRENEPVSMTCPHCRTSIITKVRYKAGKRAWLRACIICLLGWWCGCCLIPFFVDAYKDVVHSCPNCNARLRVCVYRRL